MAFFGSTNSVCRNTDVADRAGKVVGFDPMLDPSLEDIRKGARRFLRVAELYLFDRGDERGIRAPRWRLRRRTRLFLRSWRLGCLPPRLVL
jgi:hypothetical protein